MLRNTMWLLLPLLALVAPSSAQASGSREGGAEGHDVVIDLTTRTASGSMGTARLEPISSPDTDVDKSIGCAVDATETQVLVQCIAFNSLGWLGCISTNAKFISAVSAINGDSKITFTAKANGNCERILIDNNSMYQPKAN